MKRGRLSYDEWKCITSKELSGKQVCTDFYKGYIGLLKIKEVFREYTNKCYDIAAGV